MLLKGAGGGAETLSCDGGATGGLSEVGGTTGGGGADSAFTGLTTGRASALALFALIFIFSASGGSEALELEDAGETALDLLMREADRDGGTSIQTLDFDFGVSGTTVAAGVGASWSPTAL